MRVTRFFVCFLFLLALLAEQRVFADTIASTTAQAGNVVNTSSSQNPNCPVGPCGVVPPPPGGIPPANQQILQSQASDGTGASANALVNLVTGSLGVQATGSSQSFAFANANFSNEWYCASTCGEIPFRGVPALLHFTLDGTITPPFLLDTSSVSFGGSLGVQFNWQENDIGGGSASFSFDTSYDDTLDVGSPTAQVTFDGTTTSLSSPNFTYLTQPNGTVDVAVNWTQPLSICPNGCIVLTEGIGTNPVTGGLFGTSSSANIQAEQQPGAAGSSGADFSATFNTTITSLDPSFSFFSDSGDASLSPSPIATPEPDSLVLFGSGLLGIIAMSSRRRRLRARIEPLVAMD